MATQDEKLKAAARLGLEHRTPSKYQAARSEREAQQLAQARAPAVAPEDDPLVNPEAAFAGMTEPESPEQVAEFQALPEDGPYRRAGRDFYTNPDGQLVSVDAGFDTSNDYPDWVPATAEQVAARDEEKLQARRGGLGDQLDTFTETGLASLAEAYAGVSNAGRNLGYTWPHPETNVRPEDIAPVAFTDAALEKRQANPKSALAGAIGMDLVTSTITGGGVTGALVGGVTGAGADSAITGEPFQMTDAMHYGMLNGGLEAVAHVPWLEAMRSLGKKAKTALESSVEGAKAASVAEALAEKDPVRKADLLRQNAEAIYERTQNELDQHLANIDERMATAPDKLFTPGVLKRTVSENVTAQAEHFERIATQLDQAAQVTEIPVLQEAAALLEAARGQSGPQMFGSLRQARKLLNEGIGKLWEDTPLTRESLQAIEDTLVDEPLWGRAAKNHAQFSTPVAATTEPIKVSAPNARELLDARLEAVRTTATLTGDKRLAAAIKGASAAMDEAGQVTGSRLMSPLRTAVVGHLSKLAKGAIEGHTATALGAVGGGLFGSTFGPAGALAGTAIGTAAARVISKYAGKGIDQIAERLARGRLPHVPEPHVQMGESWTRRLWKEAKAKAKANPGATLGAAALVGAGAAAAAGDEQSDGAAPLAASVGLVGILAAFLPPGGRRALAEVVGEKLAVLSARERMAVRVATGSAAGDVETALRRYAAGERHMDHEAFGDSGTWPLTSADDVTEAQKAILLKKYAERAGLENVEDVPAPVQDAIAADVAARNAATIENDKALRRLAEPGRLDLLPRAERLRSAEELYAESKRAYAALNEDEMPPAAMRLLDDQLGLVRPRGDPMELWQVATEQALGRPPSERETAYAQAVIDQTADMRERGNLPARTPPELRVVSNEPPAAEAATAEPEVSAQVRLQAARANRQEGDLPVAFRREQGRVQDEMLLDIERMQARHDLTPRSVGETARAHAHYFAQRMNSQHGHAMNEREWAYAEALFHAKAEEAAQAHGMPSGTGSTREGPVTLPPEAQRVLDDLVRHVATEATIQSRSVGNGHLFTRLTQRFNEEFRAHLSRAPTDAERRVAMDAFTAAIEQRLARHGLRALPGEGQPVEGSPEFRRLGLPEPQQPSEVPIQMKLGLPPPEPPVTITDSNPELTRGTARRTAILNRRLRAMNAIQPGDIGAEGMNVLRRLQARLSDANLRTWSDEIITQSAQSHARQYVQDYAAEFAELPNARAREYVESTLEGYLHHLRDQQRAAAPLTLDEQVNAARIALRSTGDLPEQMHHYLLDQHQRLRDSISADTTVEEVARRARQMEEDFADKFVVSLNRKPNARERAYAALSLLDEGQSRREIEVRARNAAQLRDETARAAIQAQAAERDAAAKAARTRTERERARVEDLMGGLDLPEEQQSALARRAEASIQALNVQEDYHHDAGVGDLRPLHDIDTVIDHMRKLGPVTPGEEVFLRDQMGESAPEALDWLHNAVDSLVNADEWYPGDGGSVPDLDFDDLLHEVEEQRGGSLTPWEEWHVRHEFDENQSRIERSYENQLEERRSERKSDYEANLEREREEESEDEDEGGGYVHDMDDLIDRNKNSLTSLFHREPTPDEMLDLFAVPVLEDFGDQHGMSLNTDISIGRDRMSYEAKLSARGRSVDIARRYTKTADGFEVYHSHLLMDGVTDKGLGRDLIMSMFRGYEALGGKKVEVSAIEIGKYFWPSLGFRPSPEGERKAIEAFFGSAYAQQNGFNLKPETIERLKGEIKTLRDLCDATVPKEEVSGQYNRLNETYRRGAGRDPQPFAKVFERGDEFKLGKHFMISVPNSSWNNGLEIRINKANDWYREFRSRLGLQSLGAVGTFEMLKALAETTQHVSLKDDAEQPAEEVTPSQADDEAKLQTHSQLEYVTSQARSLMSSTARALTTPSQRDRKVTVKPGLTQSQGVAAFAGAHDNLRSAFAEKRGLLQKLQQDPMSLVNELAESYSDVAHATPDLHRQIVAQTYKVVAFLQTKLPSTIGASLMRPDGTPPSDTALRQFALYYSAATNPSTVHVDLANNRARKEQVDTLKELWPESYQDLKVAVLGQLSDGSTRPTLTQRSRLDLLFDFGDSLDKALSPRLVTARMAYLEQVEQGAQSKAAPSRRTQPSITGAGPLAALSRGTAAA